MPIDSSYDIRAQRPHDLALLAPLLDRTFGPDRQARTVYRLREGVAPVPELCFAAVDRHDQVLASLRFWPIRIATLPAILLGPLAVEPALQGRGMGRALVTHGKELLGIVTLRDMVLGYVDSDESDAEE